MKASFKKALGKVVLMTAFFTAVFVTSGLAQQSGTADKPTGAKPGATDTVQTTPTYKPLDSLMQETKPAGEYPWSNDPEYIRQVKVLEKERDADLKLIEKKRKRQIEQADSRRDEINTEINSEYAVLAAKYFFGNKDSYYYQQVARLEQRRQKAQIEYEDKVSSIEYEAEVNTYKASDRCEERIEKLNDKFAKDKKYKDQSQLFMFKEKRPDRPHTFSKA